MTATPPAPVSPAREAAVAKVVADHLQDGPFGCECGWRHDFEGALLAGDDYAAHVAAVLLAEGGVLDGLLAEARAEALREAADDLPALTEGLLRVGTALWPESDRDAYSLAIEEAQSALRDRADAAGGGQ